MLEKNNNIRNEKGQKKSSDSIVRACDPAGIWTQDPYIKSVMLYQLSYEIKNVI